MKSGPPCLVCSDLKTEFESCVKVHMAKVLGASQENDQEQVAVLCEAEYAACLVALEALRRHQRENGCKGPSPLHMRAEKSPCSN